MSAFKLAMQQIKEKIDQASLEQALEQLLAIEPSRSSEHREKTHWEGKIHMRHGQFDQAIELFLEADSRWGHHVALLLDLAACYYLSGKMYLWRQTLDLAEYEFKNNQHLIEPKRQIFSLLMLAKFKEELGSIAEAIELHEENLSHLDQLDLNITNTIQKLRIQAQILRLRSEYDNPTKGFQLYSTLNQVNAKSTNWDCEFEIEHALMIFEAKYFGLEYAKVRFAKLLQNPMLQTAESTLIYSDLIYEILISKQNVPMNLLKEMSLADSLSPYDRQLLEISSGNLPAPSRLIELSEELSPAQLLRIYILLTRIETNAVHGKAIQLLTSNLSPISKKMWIQNQSEIENKAIYYSKKSGTLLLEGENLEVVLNSAAQEIISQMIGIKEIEFEILVKKLWNGTGDDADVARLRMRLKRLNSQIETAWGIQSFAKIKEVRVVLASELRLKLDHF